MDKMTVVMLEAVSTMIKDCIDMKVQCAKTMLDKILEGMNESKTFVQTVPLTIVKDRPEVIQVVPGDEYLFSTKEDGSLKDIKVVTKRDDVGDVISSHEVDDDMLIDLDGKAYPYKNAKGKKFKTGRVL